MLLKFPIILSGISFLPIILKITPAIGSSIISYVFSVKILIGLKISICL